ncbi:MAG TPA: hypothetical protein VMZ73_04540 [Acidimicrobiales bacterium]|nr:hypothetical protein [Acidimicrobiales bacterium]
MSEQGNRQENVAGDTDHPQHRAGAGEGVRAPFASETGVSEISVFDGAGNESVVRTVGGEGGERVQGTGPTSAAAAENADDLLEKGGRQDIGADLGPVHGGSPNP